MNSDEREWQAQELATKAERAGNVSLDLDGLSAGYLPIARALRKPMPVMLDAGFAARVAQLAATGFRPVDVDSRMEQRMLLVLGAVLAVSGLVVALIYGGRWMAPALNLLGLMGPSTASWLLVLTACLGLSWLGEQFRQRAESSRIASQ